MIDFCVSSRNTFFSLRFLVHSRLDFRPFTFIKVIEMGSIIIVGQIRIYTFFIFNIALSPLIPNLFKVKFSPTCSRKTEKKNIQYDQSWLQSLAFNLSSPLSSLYETIRISLVIHTHLRRPTNKNNYWVLLHLVISKVLKSYAMESRM